MRMREKYNFKKWLTVSNFWGAVHLCWGQYFFKPIGPMFCWLETACELSVRVKCPWGLRASKGYIEAGWPLYRLVLQRWDAGQLRKRCCSGHRVCRDSCVMAWRVSLGVFRDVGYVRCWFCHWCQPKNVCIGSIRETRTRHGNPSADCNGSAYHAVPQGLQLYDAAKKKQGKTNHHLKTQTTGQPLTFTLAVASMLPAVCWSQCLILRKGYPTPCFFSK